jgi:uncharacterized protein YjbJ (UPF0337 family)
LKYVSAYEQATVIRYARHCAALTAVAHELHAVRTMAAYAPVSRENNMNRDQLKGVAQQVKGKVNEIVGKATGNRTQQLKGDLQQAAGTARKAFGDGKQKIRRLGR